MKVILQEDVRGIGKKGQAVKVKDGYGRNFLLPRGLALKATSDNLAAVEKRLKFETERLNEQKNKTQELADKLSGISCTVSVDTHDDDKLYGSITAVQIAASLETEGIFLDKKQIILDEPIKDLGIYSIEVRLSPEVKAKLKVWVVKNK